MKHDLERMSVSQMIAIFLFIGSMVFLFFEFITTPFINPYILFIPVFAAVLYIVTAYGQFLPLVRNSNFQSDSGINGTVYNKTPHKHGGGEVGYELCLFKYDLPRNIKRRVNKGVSGLFTWLAGVITVEIIAKKDRWEWVKNSNSETDCGCLQLHGRLDGTKIESRDTRLRDLLARKSKTLSYVITEIETLEAQLSLAMQSRNKDIDKSSEFLKKIADRVKNVKIISKGAGSDLSAIADEEGGKE